MTVWYFHGLESKQGGPKVEFLNKVAENVFAPEMNYQDSNLFEELLSKSKEERPDLIIGSSMGGYFADAIGSNTGIKVLLFNPALHSRRMEPAGVVIGNYEYKRHFVVGSEDTIIDPILTKGFIKPSDTLIVKKGMGHRTSLIVFVDIYNKLFTKPTVDTLS